MGLATTISPNVTQGDKHPQQQKDPLPVIFLRQASHQQVAERLARSPNVIGTLSIEIAATERPHGIVDPEVIDAEDLDGPARPQLPERGRCRRKVEVETSLQDIARFGLGQRNVAQAERSHRALLHLGESIEDVGENEFLRGLHQVRACFKSRTKALNAAFIGLRGDLERVLDVER